MTFVTAAPEMVASSASELARVGSTLGADQCGGGGTDHRIDAGRGSGTERTETSPGREVLWLS